MHRRNCCWSEHGDPCTSIGLTTRGNGLAGNGQGVFATSRCHGPMQEPSRDRGSTEAAVQRSSTLAGRKRLAPATPQIMQLGTEDSLRLRQLDPVVGPSPPGPIRPVMRHLAPT
ncbi:uncharacterized protein LOC144132510 isoform X1 [Amblyomma americanum]